MYMCIYKLTHTHTLSCIMCVYHIKTIQIHFNESKISSTTLMIDRLFVRYAGSFMRTATRRKSASSIELWCTVTPSSPSWPSLKPWATSRSNMRTVAERWVHTAFPPQINHTHPLYSITHTHTLRSSQTPTSADDPSLVTKPDVWLSA